MLLLLLALDGHVLLELLLLLVVPHREYLVVLPRPLLLAQLALELGRQLLQLHLPLLLDAVDHLINGQYILEV